ncbi:MAG TPA: hypothetical protein VMV32_06985 [Ignavibacteriaceae bacterium]|nr:hypothetical protein [Ignavibacteriaceae bacterium]
MTAKIDCYNYIQAHTIMEPDLFVARQNRIDDKLQELKEAKKENIEIVKKQKRIKLTIQKFIREQHGKK